MGQNEEKELLKKELGGLHYPEAIEKLKGDAELLGHEDIAALAQEKLDILKNTAESISDTSPEVKSGIVSVGGNTEAIATQLAEVDAEIGSVKADAESQIKALEKAELETSNVILQGEVKGPEITLENELPVTEEQRPYPEGILRPALEMATKSPSFSEFKKAVEELNSLTTAGGESIFGNKFDSDADIAKESFIFTLGQQEPGTRKGLDEVQNISKDQEEELVKLTKKSSFDILHARRVKGIVERFNKLAPEIYAAYLEANEKLAKEVDDFMEKKKQS
jgi:hypothetical protein